MFSWFGHITKRHKSPGQRVFVSLPIGLKPVCVCESVVIKWHADRDVMVSQEQRNSQRGVGTACQSRGGSHSQGCHWRKRLESCIETERDKDRRERDKEEENRDENTSRKAEGRERVTGRRDPRTGNREERDKAVRNKVRKQAATKSISSCAR